jgi:uncharacterized protein (DUF1499 family)
MMSNLMRYIGPAIGIVALLVTLWIFSYIEDWSRDLTTNVAETSPNAKDERLRTRRLPLSLDDLEQKLKKIADAKPLWSYDRTETVDASTRKIHLIRTTSLMRYKDDISVTLKREGEETVLDVYSKSRIGKGDLGQNPKNIRELLAYLAPPPSQNE